MTPKIFRCFFITKAPGGTIRQEIAERSVGELPPGDVLIRVAYSSLNYKDALAATGHPGVNKVFPHVPGVDAAGTVVESGSDAFVPGDQVIVTGFDMGSNRWGGWGEYVRVPRDWIVPLPDGITLRESMILGTAGFTAALCAEALARHDVGPASGPVVVTGASGGVGSFAVAILAKLGYRVAAVTGKEQSHEYLRTLGAAEVLGRDAVDDRSGKPLLSGRWAGAVDTVGGNILGTILRSTMHDGCVAACGLAGGSDLPVTVYPFILRAVTLSGVNAAWCPIALRHKMWRQLAGQWKVDHLERLARFVNLQGLPPQINDILAGRIAGRVVVTVCGEP